MITLTGKLLDYTDWKKYGHGTFIETGSGHGDGIQRALDAGFARVVSVEAKDRNFEICTFRFLTDPRVKLVYADSTKVLLPILEAFPGRHVVFLDAHVSGEASAGYEEWLAGHPEFTQDAIIRRELDILLAREENHVIIIDDINGHADGFADEYVEMILKVKPNYSFYFYSENLGGEHLYEDKILVAEPGE